MSTSPPLQRIFYLLLALVCLPVNAEDDDNSHADNYADQSIFIDSEIQLATGIQTLQLHSSQFTPEIETFATRVDLAPLINLRTDYFLAQAQQDTANIKLQQSQRNVQRLQNLQRDKAVSTRKLRDQQTQLKIDQIQFNAAMQQTLNLRLFAQTNWGDTLSDWFLNSAMPSDQMLSALDKSIYLVYLPTEITAPSKSIFIQPSSLREKAQPASLISAAPALLNSSQQSGTAFYYLSDQPVPAGQQRVSAWLPLNTTKTTGVIIPASALVWHLGQAFVYLQLNNEQFKRIKINEKKLIHSNAYFIHTQLHPGDRLVSTGAQMLLSEEFRSQIPAEDDDDDD